MATCHACGKENPGGARFCNDCATPLTSESREQRKTLLARYFERMKAIVESHGGTVEKFIGDADALRAGACHF